MKDQSYNNTRANRDYRSEYALVSTDDQSAASQLAALKLAGC